MNAIEKLQNIKNSLIWAVISKQVQVRKTGSSHTYYLSRRQLKGLIKKATGVYNRHSVNTWIETIVSYGLVRPNPHEDRMHRPTNSTRYNLNWHNIYWSDELI